jgi:endonuclease/exonuclease/phosphatase family metal-dependent hydrolase
MVIATHNLMHGLRLPGLLLGYAALRERIGLHVLCVQENAASDGGLNGDRIAAALGGVYAHCCVPAHPGLGIVYDRALFEVTEAALVPLPRLARLSWFEKTYIVGGRTRPKYAQLVALRPRGGGDGFAVANFHFDTAGDNAHRRAQMAAVADALAARGWTDRVAACGDTNAFAWRRGAQLAALRALLDPIAVHGAVDPGTAPTHWFARQREPKLPHRIGVALGALGLDLPRRYDVVCTNLAIAGRGQLATPDSDHDLVWAQVRT